MTKYKITNNGRLYEYIRKYKDYRPDPVFRNTVLKGGAADKLFSNPVTSIAYNHEFPKTLISDYDMDKKDIIKALDFWINDRVLQNEKMLALNGNLKDFEESELKDLISIKTYVTKLPNDTIFKRFNRTGNDGYNVIKSDTVEFYHQVAADIPLQEPRNHIPTISDDNRNIGGDLTFNWSPFNRLTRAALFNGDDDFRDQIVGRHIFGAGTDDEISPVMRAGRHSDNGERNYDIGINTNTGEVDQAPTNGDPHTWIVVSQRHDSDGHIWKVVDPNGITIADEFTRIQDAERFINERRTPSSTEPPLPNYVIQSLSAIAYNRLNASSTETEEHNTTFENMYVNTMNASSGRNSVEVQFRGTNGAEMTVHIIPNRAVNSAVGDGPHWVRLLGNSRILIDGNEYMVTEPIRVSYSRPGGGIPTTTSGTPATFDGNDDLYIDYLTMICIADYAVEVGSEYNYLTANMTFSGSLVDIDLQMYVTNSVIDTISASLQSHIVRIFTHRKDIIEIDGHRVHVLSMGVTYK